MVTKSKDRLITRLEKYLDKLKSGEKVVRRDLQAVLTPDELLDIDFEWENAKAYKESVFEMGRDLSSYTEMLHTADKVFNIAENGSKLPKSQRTELYADAEKRYERALEHLRELLAGNIGLEIALDRRFCFDPGVSSTADSASVPRWVFSRAQHAEPPEWPTIKSIRINALETKLAGLTGKTSKRVKTSGKNTTSATRLRKLANK